MEYIFNKAIKMLKWNKWISVLLIIELMLGMSVFSYALNLSCSLQKREAENKKQKNDIVLNVMVKDIEQGGNNIFDLEDYNEIQKITDQKAFTYIAIPQIIPDDSGITEYTLLLMDYSQMELQEDFFYFGKNIYNLNDKINFSFPMQKSRKMSEHLNAQKIQTEVRTIEYKDSLIIPIKYIDEDDFKNEITGGALHIELDTSEYEDVGKVSLDIVHYMSQKYGDKHSFKMSSPQIDLQNNARKVKISIETLNKAGVLLMLVFFVGVISIFQLLIIQRTKEYGICIACGATVKQISLELGLEIFFLCMVGSIAGCVLGFIATYYLDMGIMISIVKVTGHIETVVGCLLIGMGITFFASLPLVIKICKKETGLLFD